MLKGQALKNHITRKGLFKRIEIPAYDKPVAPEILLGRSILDRAFLDSFNSLEEFEWFSVENEDFLIICYLANLDPEVIEKHFTKVYKDITEHE